MKKFLLVAVLCLMTVTTVKAAQWVNIDTESDKFQVYVDKDHIIAQNSDIVFYPLLVKETDKNPVILYVKADYSHNKAGIITEHEYNPDNYNPFLIFSNFKTYLKPIIPNTVMDYGYKYMACRLESSKSAQITCRNVRAEQLADEDRIIVLPNRNINSTRANKIMVKSVKENWKVPASGKNKSAQVHLIIGKNGSLESYSFIKSTGNENADRAIISAIELTVPFKSIENTAVTLIFNAEKLFKEVISSKIQNEIY